MVINAIKRRLIFLSIRYGGSLELILLGQSGHVIIFEKSIIQELHNTVQYQIEVPKLNKMVHYAIPRHVATS